MSAASPTDSHEGAATTRVVCQQLAPRIGDLAYNRELSLAAIESAVALGAEIIVLPELTTSGYCFSSRDEASSLAIAAGDELFVKWARALCGAGRIVIGGFCERGAGGRLYNSAACVDSSGLLAIYRKAHLWDREKLVFEAGGELPPLLDTVVGRIGMLICYDLEFPEMPRLLALGGAQLIAVPTNWPLLERPAGEHPPEVLAAMVAARASRVVVACCDRTGVERGQQWTSGTAIVDEQGWVVARPDEHGTALADVGLERTRDKALGERNDLFTDRRAELYGALAGRVDPSDSRGVRLSPVTEDAEIVGTGPEGAAGSPVEGC